MGVLDRITTLIKANVNDLLDKAEDPAKVADQLVLDMADNLAEVRRRVAEVAAQSKRAKSELDEAKAQVDRMARCAEKAVRAGNDDDARTFLEEKHRLEEKVASLQSTYDTVHVSEEKLRDAHDQLVRKLNELKGRRDAIKAKTAAAEAQKRAAGVTGSVSKSESALEAFDRMEDKAEAALNESGAMLELSDDSDPVAGLADKYDDGASGSVEDELAALKAKVAGESA